MNVFCGMQRFWGANLRLVLIVAAFVVAVPALSQSLYVGGGGVVSSHFIDADGNARLLYWGGERAAESLLADLTCDRFHHPSIAVHIPDEIALRWLGDQAGQPGPIRARLSLGTDQAELLLTATRYDFMIGEWVLVFEWRQAEAADLARLAQSTEFVIVTSGFQVTLSEAEDHLTNLTAFAAACLAL